MLNVYRSNRGERLLEALARILEEPMGRPTESEWIAVPSAAMGTRLGIEMARRFGVWCGAELPLPRRLIENILAAVLKDGLFDLRQFDEDSLTWSIMALLPGFLDRSEFSSLAAYLEKDNDGLKRFQLATKIARALHEYTVYRPDVILEWEDKEPSHWQSILWKALVNQRGSVHIARGAKLFFDSIRLGPLIGSKLPRRISLVGVSHLPPLFMRILAAAGDVTEVNLFVESPSREYWAHIRSGRSFLGDILNENEEPDLHLEQGHPLLATLGRMGRDFQRVLETTSYHETAVDLYKDPREDKQSLLRTLQSDILHLGNRRPRADTPEETPLEIDPEDESILVHSCHSPMREVQVLRDQLLKLFNDKDLDLRPEDVLVLVPEITAYAPFIDAVFRDALGTSSDIPYVITGADTHTGAEVLDAFFALIDLARNRVSIHEVFDLIQIAPVRERFGLEETDVDIARKWMENAGVRWGIDGPHRASHGQPELEENTWRFGLKRLFLGYAMPGEEQNFFGGTLPFDEMEGGQVDILGRFTGFAERLFEWINRLDGQHSPAWWSSSLMQLLEEMVASNRAGAHQHQLIRQALEELSTKTERAAFDGEVGPEVICSFLNARLDSSRSTAGRAVGGVVFSSLLTMRNLPVKVVCLMGMNEQDFPRSRQPPGFDIMAGQPRVGDRSVRHDDRYRFLESLLAARERLLITYVGQNIQDGSEIPPSVVVSELMEAVGQGFYVGGSAGTGNGDAVIERLVVKHPLHPFSPAYFETGGDPRLFSFSTEHCDGARAILGVRSFYQPFLTEPLPLPEETERVIDIEDLVGFFKSPCSYLLARRLGIYFDDDLGEVADREPINLSPLEEHIAGSDLLQRILDGDDPDELYRIFKARGVLPLGTSGRVRYEELRDETESLVQTVRSEMADEPAEPVEFNTNLKVDDLRFRLVGTLSNVWPTAVVRARYGTVKPKDLLDLWIRHLALNSLDDDCPKRSIFIGRENRSTRDKTVFSQMETDPSEPLEDLLRLYLLGQTVPLRFIPRVSFRYVETLRKTGDSSGALTAARQDWRKLCEIPDPAVTRFFGIDKFIDRDGMGEKNEFEATARRVFEPLMDNLERS
ncbi:MAG: exodeoxyribonuclease V subunit gamma [Deltaproteobacteria bacterium]|nr:exodeoxyribonuclease V subunit gamma [Deltaproteobacteria bacterium]